MAVLNTHLSDLQESVKQLSPMFKDDKVVTLVQTAKKELDILIGEATHFENTVCTFFGVNNIEELRRRMQRVSTITSNFSQASWGQTLKTIQTDIQRYKDDSQSQAYETLKKYVDEVLETYNGEIRTNEELTKDVLDKVRTMKRAQDRVIKHLKELDVNSDYTFIVAHVDALEAAKEYAQKIESQIEGAKVKVINLVSAVGIHTGLGCLALQVFNEMKDQKYQE